MPFKLLWADDEIDLLKPHIIFLKSKGYDVTTANSGADALEMVDAEPYDLVILDENMPGLTGLETLQHIKESHPTLPVIMITKSEEENIMDQAVGSKIADYLIKPVNPNQILLSIKKNLHSEELVNQSATDLYRQEFPQISAAINAASSLDDWKELYRKLTFWELELAQASTNMDQLLEMQRDEADKEWAKFVRRNYESWMDARHETQVSCLKSRVLMSPDIMKETVMPLLNQGQKVLFVVIDNFRLDQWMAVKPLLADMFNFSSDDLYCSILPTATQYARNAIFSGLMPVQIEKMFPQLWVDEDSEEGKNLNESPLLSSFFERYRRQDIKFSYHKINDNQQGEKLAATFANQSHNDLVVAVYNFIDMMSHARTDSRMMRELAATDAAYRSLTVSWMRHSSLLDLLREAARRKWRVVITTDHGTIRVDNPLKVIGERSTNTNLRYKLGRNLSYPARQVYEIKDPRRYGLPSPNVSTTYIFATGRDFFAYPNNWAHYVQYYTNTFQHGGISLQEMLIPVATLDPK